MRILWILVPGAVVGVIVMDGVRRIFSEDETLVRRLFADQPVTMLASALIVGSVIVWAVLEILSLWGLPRFW